MDEIVFRQALKEKGVFCGWHHWGLINGKFIEPATNPGCSMESACKNSRRFIGHQDNNGEDIYAGAILRCKRTKRFKGVFTGSAWEYPEPEIFYANSVIEWWDSPTHIGYRLKDQNGKHMKFQPSHIRAMQMEVIGSTDETPELLHSEGTRG